MGVTAMIAPGLPGSTVSVDMLDLLPGKQLRGGHSGRFNAANRDPDTDRAVWQAGRFPYDKLITTYDGIDALDAAVSDMHAGKVIKPVVLFGDSP